MTAGRIPPDEPDAVAGHLAAQRGTAAWTPADEARLTSWLDADPAHRASFARAQRLQAAIAAAADLREVQRVLARYPRGRRRGRRAALIAAAALVLIAGAGVLVPWPRPDAAAPRASPMVFATAPGELRSIDLADGSRVDLDEDSAIACDLAATRRRVALTRGRAVFSVTGDASRPFIVAAGVSEARVLGTVFAVEHRLEAVLVTVAEGRASVRHYTRDGGPVPSESDLIAGQQAVLADTAGVRQVSTTDFAPWRAGRLAFVDLPLVDVIAEAQRYTTRRLAVDPAVAHLRLTGTFQRAGREPLALLHGIAAVLPVRIEERDGGEIRLMAKR